MQIDNAIKITYLGQEVIFSIFNKRDSAYDVICQLASGYPKFQTNMEECGDSQQIGLEEKDLNSSKNCTMNHWYFDSNKLDQIENISQSNQK